MRDEMNDVCKNVSYWNVRDNEMVLVSDVHRLGFPRLREVTVVTDIDNEPKMA